MTGDWILWLGWFGMASLYAAMIYVAWRALFHDRGKRRRRCPKCWHDLSHTPGMTCGECGFTADYESQFHRTRRKLAVAAGSIVVCVLAAGFIHQRMDQRGWAAIAPTNVLIWTLPLSIDGQSFSKSELTRRMNLSTFTEKQWLAVLERCAEGDWWRTPVEDEWEDTYGRILDQWDHTFSRLAVANVASQGDSAALNRELLFRQQVRDVVLDIPPRVLASTRDDWPAGSAPRVNVTLREWWPREFETRLLIKTPGEDGKQISAFRGGRFGGAMPFSLEIPANAAENMPSEIEITVQRRETGGPWKSVSAQRVPITTYSSSADDVAMQPADDPAMNDDIRAAFSAGVVRWASGPSPVRFRVDVPATATSRFDGVAIGVRAELFRDGARARRLDLWWLGGLLDERNYNFEIVYEDLELLNSLGSDSAKWTLIVTGEQAIADRAGPAPRFWHGSVELPVVVAQQNGPSPPRPWWTDQQQAEQTGEYSAAD